MQELITIVENEPRVSHRVVAEQTENQQKNVNELIKKYHDEFEEFGRVPFKTEGDSEVKLKQKDNPDYRPNKTYYLNEPQATFLMTLLRNKPVVVEFKKKLVKEFYSQREKLQTPNDTNEHDLLHVVLKLVENQQRQTDAILELAQSMKQTPQLAPQTQQVQYLDSRDRKKLRDAIQEKAKEVARDLGVSVSTISPSIWIELKRFFDVDDYQDILKSQVKDVMHFVMFWEAKKGSVLNPYELHELPEI